MRGKPACRVKLDPLPRLIPAHAGKTRFGAPQARSAGAHPRSCGENAPGIASASWFQGSSPRTRGKHAPVGEGFFFPGLIPAHAGKNRPARRRTSLRGAHPRSCEENRVQARRVLRLQGSSPLTRGKPRGEWAPCVPEGLIPAHAGITSETRPCPRCGAAHPRSRGENLNSMVCSQPP